MRAYVNKFKEVLSAILWNWQVLLLFEFLYKLLGGVLLFPFIRSTMQKTLELAQIPYLTMDVLKDWLLSPFTLLFILGIMILLGLYIFYEMLVLVTYFDDSYHKRPVHFSKLIMVPLKRSLHALKPNNWPIFLLVVLLFPLTSLSLTPSALTQVRIPEYFVDFVKELGMVYYLGFLILILLINLLVFSLLYVVPVFMKENKSFYQSLKASRELLNRRFLKTLGTYASWMLIITSLCAFIFATILFVMVVYTKQQPVSATLQSSFLINYMLLKQFSSFIFQMIMFFSSFAVIMFMYLSSKELVIVQNTRKPKRHRIRKAMISIIEVLCLFVVLAVYIDYQGNAYEVHSIMEKPIDIAAHRAGAVFAPENTIPALENAIQSKAAYAEIDVQQSKDGKLYILHDTSFKRTTGIAKQIWEVSAEEINTFDAGSYFSPEFEGTKIPTLEEMMKVADGKIKLMIELKKNGHENELEQQTVELIQRYKFQNQCAIASMDLSVLQKVKELDPSLITVYIAPVVYGDIYTVSYIDIVSVEATFVNTKMIKQLHEHHKSIFVWTINKDDELKRILSMDIDGIVTDNPELAFFYKQQGGKDDIIASIIAWLFPQS